VVIACPVEMRLLPPRVRLPGGEARVRDEGLGERTARVVWFRRRGGDL
jgi:hypothetical protein